MYRLEEAFVRIRPGEWFCRAPITLSTPAGTVTCTPGVTYRKGRPIGPFDVAQMLDEWTDSGHVPPNTDIRAG